MKSQLPQEQPLTGDVRSLIRLRIAGNAETRDAQTDQRPRPQQHELYSPALNRRICLRVAVSFHGHHSLVPTFAPSLRVEELASISAEMPETDF
jgi:hypothetical protein